MLFSCSGHLDPKRYILSVIFDVYNGISDIFLMLQDLSS